MIFNENKLQEEIIKTWGEYGSHNEVFKAMTLQIKELKEQLNLSGVSQQRELLDAFVCTMEFDTKHGTYQEDVDYFLEAHKSV